MALIKRDERSSHWYSRTGESCHTVIAKTTGLPRATNVTDARKLGLVPSVTNILNIKAKPALDVWKQDNAILAALNTPRYPGELDGDYHSRIATVADSISKEAAEWGTLIHEQLEQYVTGGAFLGTGEILDYVAGYDAWHRANVVKVIDAEKSVVGDLGYAGRLDLHAMINHGGEVRRAIVDYKSQKLKTKAKANFYREWEIQLAAYADCLREPGEPLPLLVSLIIPSDAPGPVQMKVWENGEGGLKAFKACFALWCYEKGYDPSA
jgi:hypothetical protein